jgi:hypothetical protein
LVETRAQALKLAEKESEKAGRALELRLSHMDDKEKAS